MCLTILWDWRLKRQNNQVRNVFQARNFSNISANILALSQIMLSFPYSSNLIEIVTLSLKPAFACLKSNNSVFFRTPAIRLKLLRIQECMEKLD